MEMTLYTLKDHLIRSYDVMILGITYLVFGLASSYIINRYSTTAQATDPKIKTMMEIAAEVAITVLFSYFIHVLVEKLPLPMIGPENIKLEVIKEVRGGIVIAFAMFTLQVKLRNKIQYLFYNKIDNYELINFDA